MGNFKGTKGNFKLIKQDSLKDFKILCIGSDADNTVIAHVYFQGEITEKELANGVLLSKSKELLESVSELIKELEFHGYNHSTAINNARELIKEATEL